MENEQCDFVLLGMMDIQKSVDATTKSANQVEPDSSRYRLVIGEISNNNPDEENERLIQKSLDWSYFDDNGWIKYEHVPNKPQNVIGCPHERIMSPDGTRTIIKGAIFNKNEYADATWSLIEAINEHNKLYPDHQKCLGWSIEGNYTDGKVGKGGVRKAKVINVVITPNPVNKSVWLKKVEDNHDLFAKSLTATPVSTRLDEKVGGDAITEDNIDGDVKETAEDPLGKEQKKPKKKKSSKTLKKGSLIMFKSINEAIQHFLDQGEEQENAEKLAKSLFPDNDDDDDVSLSSLSKSISELQETIEKSVATDIDDDLPFVEIDDDDDEGDVIDAAPYLLKLNKSIADLSALVEQKIDYDNQRDAAFASALEEIQNLKNDLNAIKSFVTIDTDGEDDMGVAKAIQVLMKAQQGRPVDLSSFSIAEPSKGGDGEYEFPTYSELQKTLTKGIASKVITESEAALAEGFWRHKEAKHLDNILVKIGNK